MSKALKYLQALDLKYISCTILQLLSLLISTVEIDGGLED